MMEVVHKQSHLTAEEKEQLQNALLNFQPSLQVNCGVFKGEPLTLELLRGSKPFYGKPFSIPKAYQQITNDEISRLESIGLFNKMTSCKWAAPTLIIPKKNNTG